ncbi:MAG: hypothetical protein K9L17_03785 [Clostridiales bacterium]|nr:hypothetical protein [Clostridiales bacterium]MCF8021799.1 hypothetical protein [Clostridiales bacterium]
MGNNPFSLFLIFVLLILSSDPKAEEKLSFTREMVQKLSESAVSIKGGLDSIFTMEEEFKAKILNLQDSQNKD